MKYKVKVIALSLKGNKIAKAGDKVDESQLAGNPKDLVKGGYIVAIKLSKAEKEAAKEAKAAKDAKDAQDAKDAEIKKAYDSEVKSIKAMNVEDLKAYVAEKELTVDLEQNKPELLATILEAIKPE